MSDKNFIPTSILLERRRSVRRMWWIVAGASYSLTVAMVVLWLRSPIAHGRELDYRIQHVGTEIQTLEASINDTRRELLRTHDVLMSRAHLTGRPNWGALLSLFGEHRPEGVFLTHCDVASELGNLPIRVTIRGFAPTQADVSDYVIGLERLELFDSVSLRHTRREPVAQTTGLAFEVLCETRGDADE